MTKFWKGNNNNKGPKSVFGVAITLCNKCCYTTWQGAADFECLIVEKISLLPVWADKVRLLTLQDADHELDADEQIPNVLNRHIRYDMSIEYE